MSLSNGVCLHTLLQTLASSLIHTSQQDAFTTGCAASKAPNETCVLTGSASGELRLWNLVDYICMAVLRAPKSGRVTAVVTAENDGTKTAIAAFEDGSIKCYERTGLQRQLWSITEAHKRSCTCLSVFADSGAQFVVSGGGDSLVRVWLLRNREMITQFNEHRKELCAVLVDFNEPHILHTAAVDGAVISFDLKSGRQRMSHTSIPSSSSTCITQRLDSEREIIVADRRGRLAYFDVDLREAVAVVQEPSKSAILCCAISPCGKFLATAGDDCTLKILLVSDGELLSVCAGHSAEVTWLAWTAGGSQLITGGADACLCIWTFHLG